MAGHKITYAARIRFVATRRTWEQTGFDSAEIAAQHLCLQLRNNGWADPDPVDRLIAGETVSFRGSEYVVQREE